VGRVIQQRLWPVLREHGFDEFTSRRAWRHRTETVDVVNVRALGAYLGRLFEVTPHSFVVDLGIRLLYIPSWYEEAEVDTDNRPDETECELRWALHKRVPQPQVADAGVWFVGEDGDNLDAAIEDARDSIVAVALPWFERFRSIDAVWDVLNDGGQADPRDELSVVSIGNDPSPTRHYLRACVALRRGDRARALSEFDLLLATKPLNPVLRKPVTKAIRADYELALRKRQRIETTIDQLRQDLPREHS
jgi:hypothetical protein